MKHLIRLRRPLLLCGFLLILLHLGLCLGVAPSGDRWQLILPHWTDHIATAGLLLLVAARSAAAATRHGWRRLMPLITLVPMASLVVLVVGLVAATTQRVEIDRATLPDGRVVMMTDEPSLTDGVLGLWEQPRGWRWRRLFEPADAITYSEDGSFMTDPRLVVIPGGRHLLIRRGGIWTDCWTIVASLRPCLPEGHGFPMQRAEWLGRSRRIAAVVGADPPGL